MLDRFFFSFIAYGRKKKLVIEPFQSCFFRPQGVIVGGLDQGTLTMYDASKLMKGDDANSIIFSTTKHTGKLTANSYQYQSLIVRAIFILPLFAPGSVQALDFNPFQNNLLASGASESEIYIWDLNKLNSPMTPGAKSQPLDEVRCVAWNQQVIIESALSSIFFSKLNKITRLQLDSASSLNVKSFSSFSFCRFNTSWQQPSRPAAWCGTCARTSPSSK